MGNEDVPSDRKENKFQFAIDRGGTFTDVFAKCPGGKIRVLKLLSEDPQHYKDAPTEAIRRILQEETGKTFEKDKLIENSSIEWIRMGTTVATNALLERKGERMAFVTNKGFRDILMIGNQSRPKIFDLNIQRPENLYEEVIEVDCRVIPVLPDQCQFEDSITKNWRTVDCGSLGKFYVTKELNREKIKKDLINLKSKNINSIAVTFAHSYAFFEHEIEVGAIASELGFTHVSLSHEVLPMTRLVPRAFTACADAYLTPQVRRYVQGFCGGFHSIRTTEVLFMQSDGGLAPADSFSGARAILSGPAGGVVGYSATTSAYYDGQKPVIGFDMGGTSTDVSRFDGGYEHVFEGCTAGVTIQLPQLDINTVAAGGGSILFFRSGLFVVGPESAGAHPGPACYLKGGPLTVTDANLRLGRLLPEYFPKIFGPNEDQMLDKEVVTKKFEDVTQEVNQYLKESTEVSKEMSAEKIAVGFIKVANESMCRPIRAMTQGKGFDTSQHILACFGGAGGQHACAIARSLGMSTVFIHKYSGILSAYGMALADVVQEGQESCSKTYTKENFEYFISRLNALSLSCQKKLMHQGFNENNISLELMLNMRYEGTDCSLMCRSSSHTAGSINFEEFLQIFEKKYKSEFGFIIPRRTIIVDDIRVRGSGVTNFTETVGNVSAGDNIHPEPMKITDVFFEDRYYKSKVYDFQKLKPGHQIPGPAIIIDKLSTIVVEPDCNAEITNRGDIQITVSSGIKESIGVKLDSIILSIFGHRFMSIAEQMGRVLQRTAISTNIKERLDFSCALFGPDGGLVSNAPHIPVHLGAMQEAVQFQMRYRQGHFNRGDVILSNHPLAGGSHLPDFTVITPVFYREHEKPVFFVASRGHHADIGGITPGSMSPHSKCLADEGAAFKSFLLVEGGKFREQELVSELKAAGARIIPDNVADLQAQIAANQKGIGLVNELIDYYGLPTVQAYMDYIQENAELSVRDMLKKIARNVLEDTQKPAMDCLYPVLEAEELMDDGTPIRLKITLNATEGSAVFDFTGTGPEVLGNCNAPKAITFSALIYCLRCMVGYDVPLNQGCLVPIKVIIPEGSILNPSEEAAVVGGNVLTSQRVVDVVFKAFQACAASQGCMNNVTFGSDRWGFYETVSGGSGAGPYWDGCSGVHTHMTNTRITDVEIMERRYPVSVSSFSLRKGTGGAGKYRGGDGVLRELLFRAPLTLSLLTERRVLQPYGLRGGSPGERGLNYLRRKDGKLINLGPKATTIVKPGDLLQLHTPGGGGFGMPEGRKIK